MWKKIEIELPPEYIAELQKAASESQFTLQTQMMLVIGAWILNKNK